MKAAFTTGEMTIWNSIYGPSRGPTQGRLRILVEEFESRGLVPVMMRLGDEMHPYNAAEFLAANREACQNKDDDHVQVYYHPADCERVVGSTASTWSQWGRLILSVEGLVLEPAQDTHPAIVENVPRLRLPTAVRDMLRTRGLTTSSVCRLVSARVVAFFIAAQYEAWATPTQVAQVAPFKTTLKRQGFTVRDVLVRGDKGVDDILSGLDLSSLPPAVRQPFNAPIAAAAQDIASVVISPPTLRRQTEGESADELRMVFGRHAEEFINPVAPDVDCDEDPEEEIIGDIDAEIAAAHARLRMLQARKEAARLESKKQAFLSAVVKAVTFKGDYPVEITLQFPDRSLMTFGIVGGRNDVDDLLSDILES